jgi:hypothetical protein
MTLVTAVIFIESGLLFILGALAGLLWIALQKTDQRLERVLNGGEQIIKGDNNGAGVPSPRSLTATETTTSESYNQWRIGTYLD